jgi:hypothetical protein
MALHRDIYWVGKQWAVTGHGVQACNQKQKSQFDIEGARLWDDGVQEAVRAEKWVNTDDFEKAVAVARKYYPAPPGWTPPKKPAAPLEIASAPPPPVKSAPPPPAKPAPPPQPIVVPEPSIKPAAPNFDMHFEGLGGKLTPVWRIRTPVADRQDNRSS